MEGHLTDFLARRRPVPGLQGPGLSTCQKSVLIYPSCCQTSERPVLDNCEQCLVTSMPYPLFPIIGNYESTKSANGPYVFRWANYQINSTINKIFILLLHAYYLFQLALHNVLFSASQLLFSPMSPHNTNGKNPMKNTEYL